MAASKIVKKVSILYLSTLILYSLTQTGAIFNKDLSKDFVSNVRSKRHLIYPNVSSSDIVQLIIGAGVPVGLDESSVTVGFVLKMTYNLPNNASFYTDKLLHKDKDIIVRRRRALEETEAINRWNLYGVIAKLLENAGYSGKGCLLRAICEAAENPFSEVGFHEELLSLILTPSSTQEAVQSHQDFEYLAAERVGRTSGKCEQIFYDCKFDFMSLYTTIKDTYVA